MLLSVHALPLPEVSVPSPRGPVIVNTLGKHEVIDYAVAIAPGGQLLQLEVLEYRESHGSEIRGAKWREQFKGKHAQSPLRLHDDIYNLSGATISCRHVTEGIKRVLAYVGY